ncbi:DUF2057 domain-containing protein [Vibrio scophthalmi]|uniref:Uncharacterized protein n=1 Tax=Vibrio scophthalmi TaxID=45658 RepID=A0A1B1NM41_9VIBR|nr:DUF2057 domain-containing protein [Vibrio scophthalmi]ANS84725.1 hypothetical protein VSVS12_00937 [Vibrio scophthalmi]ANU37167.1 hypothetical protein VSVS05_02063 [Vibrio scophthalmi]
MKKWIVLSLALFGGTALADVKVTFSPDVEVLAVNGVDDISSGFGHVDHVVLENGRNQLLVRSATMIRRDGQQEKFKSKPIIMLFDAQDVSLNLVPSIHVKDGHDADNFKKNPIFYLKNNGKNVEVTTDVLFGNLVDFVRDYENELANYNKREAPASTYIYDQEEQVRKSVKIATNDGNMTLEQAIIMLKADFLRLDEASQKEFAQWANKQ